jgi:hypothetical protein
MIRPRVFVLALSAVALSAGLSFGATIPLIEPTVITAGIAAATPSPQPEPPAALVDGAADDWAPDTLELNYCPVVEQADGVEANAAKRPPHRRGFCRCSCGAPCTTSADCGGSSCDPFITCC